MCSSLLHMCDPSSRVSRSRNTCTTCSLGATCGTSVFNIRAAEVKKGAFANSLVKIERVTYVNKWSRELERSDSELSRNTH